MSDSRPPTPAERSDLRQLRAIGQVLARRYMDVADAPVPEEMLEILRTADARPAAQGPEGVS